MCQTIFQNLDVSSTNVIADSHVRENFTATVLTQKNIITSYYLNLSAFDTRILLSKRLSNTYLLLLYLTRAQVISFIKSAPKKKGGEENLRSEIIYKAIN
jgi:hypothetical protein